MRWPLPLINVFFVLMTLRSGDSLGGDTEVDSVSTLIRRWRTEPDLDAEVRWKESPPEWLQGNWFVIASSNDGGDTVREFLAQPKPLLAIRPDGWHSSSPAASEELNDYFNIGRLPDTEGAQMWFFALRKDTRPLVIHATPESTRIVVRQCDVEADTGALKEQSRHVVDIQPAAGPPQDAGVTAAGVVAVAKPGDPKQLAEGIARAKEADNDSPLGDSQGHDAALTGEPGAINALFYESWKHKPRFFEDIFAERRLPPLETSCNGLFIAKVVLEQEVGIKENDIVIRINGKALQDDNTLVNALSTLQVGKMAKLAVKRVVDTDGKREWRTVFLNIRPLAEVQVAGRVAEERALRQQKKEAAQREADEKQYVLTFAGVPDKKLTAKSIREHNEQINDEFLKVVLAADAMERQRMEIDVVGLNAAIACFTHKKQADLIKVVRDSARIGNIKRIQILLERYKFKNKIASLPNGQAMFWGEIWDKAQEAYIESLKDAE